jgi:3-deoxy-D-manno-octulosonic acid kinase
MGCLWQPEMKTHERVHEDGAGAIVFDSARTPQVGHEWFAPDFWRARDAVRVQAGGRGGVCIIDTPAGECVLRHYRRGGMVAALFGDRYLWTGRDRTRSFREFRRLAELAGRGLPVAGPLAARYVRHGLRYGADLITLRIADAPTLAQVLAEGRLDPDMAEEVGALVARFHREGAWHADLNAHNILIAADELYLIDFDRGRFRAPHRNWQQANLDRLRRSLLKLGAAVDGLAAFEDAIWKPLVSGYERTLGA